MGCVERAVLMSKDDNDHTVDASHLEQRWLPRFYIGTLMCGLSVVVALVAGPCSLRSGLACNLCREAAQVLGQLLPPPLLPPLWQQQQGSSSANPPEQNMHSYLQPLTLPACSMNSLTWQGSGGSSRSIATVAAAPASVHAASVAAAAAWLPDPWQPPAVGILGMY